MLLTGQSYSVRSQNFRYNKTIHIVTGDLGKGVSKLTQFIERRRRLEFRLSINMDNDAFSHDGDADNLCAREETYRILKTVAAKVLGGVVRGRIMDTNGNRIDGFEID